MDTSTFHVNDDELDAGIDIDADTDTPLTNPKPAPDMDFGELNELLADAMRAKQEADKVKGIREKARSGSQSTPDEAALLRKWELANEWAGTARTAFMERHECDCGRHHTVFRQEMLRQVGRVNPNNVRWTAMPENNSTLLALPRETATRITRVPVCQVCAAGKGYSLASRWVW